LGISLVPVSEALQRLEIDGLVETEPRKGTRVRIPTPRDLKGHTVVRAALECESARLCSQAATPAERRDILERAAYLDPLRSSSTSEPAQGQLLYAIHSYHVDFHLRIANAGHCDALHRLIEQNGVLVLNWVYDVASGAEILPAGFHTQLARAVVGKDPANASEAMRAHVWWGFEKLERAFRARYWKDPEDENGTARRWRATGPANGRA
jgi:DNA-binding GntR family transcriptional regulator